LDWDEVVLGWGWIGMELGWDAVGLRWGCVGMQLSRIGTGVSAWRELENCKWDEVLRRH